MRFKIGRRTIRSLGLVAVFLLLLSLVGLALPKQKITSDKQTSFDRFIQEVMREAAIPGMSLAKVQAGDVVLTRSYGLADVEQGTAVSERTLFNIASISKPIMGIVLLQLVEKGVLDLDRDINDYLSFEVDNPHIEGEVITTRHLATHTSGIDDLYEVESYVANRDSDVSLGDHLESLLAPGGDRYNAGELYLNTWPGEARKYSNLAAALAGHLVESVTGETLAEYCKEGLFASLGLESTSWLLEGLDLGTVAVPYEVTQCVPFTPICADTESPRSNALIARMFDPPRRFKRLDAYPHFGYPQYPDGGMRSSISELSQLLVAILNNRDAAGNPLLSAAMFEEMFRLQLPPDVSASQRFFWSDNRSGSTGHTGSDLGVFTAMYFDTKSKDGFIILMNRGLDSASVIAMKQIARKLIKWLDPPEEVAISL